MLLADNINIIKEVISMSLLTVTSEPKNSWWDFILPYDLYNHDQPFWTISKDLLGTNKHFWTTTGTDLRSREYSIEETIENKEDSTLISIIAPGIKKEDFKLSIENGHLSLSFIDRHKKEQIRIWDKIKVSSEKSVNANYDAGILYIEIKKEKSIVKMIPIK